MPTNALAYFAAPSSAKKKSFSEIENQHDFEKKKTGESPKSCFDWNERRNEIFFSTKK
jgi:hypothetical protein